MHNIRPVRRAATEKMAILRQSIFEEYHEYLDVFGKQFHCSSHEEICRTPDHARGIERLFVSSLVNIPYHANQFQGHLFHAGEVSCTTTSMYFASGTMTSSCFVVLRRSNLASSYYEISLLLECMMISLIIPLSQALGLVLQLHSRNSIPSPQTDPHPFGNWAHSQLYSQDCQRPALSGHWTQSTTILSSRLSVKWYHFHSRAPA
jgi:hypothetical protein